MINILVTQNLKEILGICPLDVEQRESEDEAGLVLDLTGAPELACLIPGQSDPITTTLTVATVPLIERGHVILGRIQITGHERVLILKMSIKRHTQGEPHLIPPLTETYGRRHPILNPIGTAKLSLTQRWRKEGSILQNQKENPEGLQKMKP